MAFRDTKAGYGALPFVDTPARAGTPRTSTKLVEAAGWPVRTGVRIPPPPEHLEDGQPLAISDIARGFPSGGLRGNSFMSFKASICIMDVIPSAGDYDISANLKQL